MVSSAEGCVTGSGGGDGWSGSASLTDAPSERLSFYIDSISGTENGDSSPGGSAAGGGTAAGGGGDGSVGGSWRAGSESLITPWQPADRG